MIKNKKAQGLSLTTIIIAIIALLVLVVIALIFTGTLGDWAEKVKGIFTGKDCVDDLGGRKVLVNVGCEDDETPYAGFVKDMPEGYVCCVSG